MIVNKKSIFNEKKCLNL